MTLRATPVHGEAARYRARLVFVPGLWAAPAVWRGVASYLGHRGWQGELLDLSGVPGGVAGRADAVAAHVQRAPEPIVLIGHDAGAVVAALAARSAPVAATVLVAPLEPGDRAVRVLTRRWDAVAALLRGRPIPPPTGAAAARCFGVMPAEVQGALAPEPADVVLDVVRGRVPFAAPGVPTLLAAAAEDPLVRAPAALAARLDADFAQLHPARGHWPMAGPGWQATVGSLHRWLVRRLGQELLEFYEEAMADREGEDE